MKEVQSRDKERNQGNWKEISKVMNCWKGNWAIHRGSLLEISLKSQCEGIQWQKVKVKWE